MERTAPTLSPRKTPSQARARATVEAIVEAAARILESKGLPGFSTNAVAAKAGVSIGTLYQYFGDKDAITAALIRRQTDSLVAEVAGALNASNAADSLRHIIQAAVRHQLQRPALARFLDIEEERLPLASANAAVASRISAIAVELLARLDPAVSQDIETTCADVFALIRGIVDGAGRRGETDPKALALRVERAVFGYLTTPEPPRTDPAYSR